MDSQCWRGARFATFADPRIWEQFDFSYKAQAAAKYAFTASRAENETDFRKNITELRLTCDNCHATFQRTTDKLRNSGLTESTSTTSNGPEQFPPSHGLTSGNCAGRKPPWTFSGHLDHETAKARYFASVAMYAAMSWASRRESVTFILGCGARMANAIASGAFAYFCAIVSKGGESASSCRLFGSTM